MAKILDSKINNFIQFPIEVRILKARGKSTTAGYFDNLQDLENAVGGWDAKRNIFVTINPVGGALMARSHNQLRDYARDLTKDKDIQRVRKLLIDIDAERPAGVSSTNDEHSRAIEKAREIKEFLSLIYGVDSWLCDSGNGAHVVVELDMANTPENVNGLKSILLYLGQKNNDDMVKVDKSTYNPSRITKLYGTTAVKGENTQDRPHRRSKILESPKTSEPQDITLLMNMAAGYFAERQPAINHERGHGAFDLPGWLDRHNLSTARIKPDVDRTHYVLDRCPMDSTHEQDKAACVTQLHNGAIAFKCHHNRCSGYRWEDVRKKYEPDYEPGGINAKDVFSGWPMQSSTWPMQGEELQTLKPKDYSDVGQGKVLSQFYGNVLRYTEATGYLIYNRMVWEENKTKAQGLAQKLTWKQRKEAAEEWDKAQKIQKEALLSEDEQREVNAELKKAEAFKKHVKRHRDTHKINATLTAAQPMLLIGVEELDSKPFLLNTPGGTVDLKTGTIQPHNPHDLCTRITGIAPGKKGADLFADFLGTISCGDIELQNYLQLIAGMSAVGKVFAEQMIIAYGGGRNGKSTFFNLLSRVMGNYSGGLSAEFLTINNRQNKKPEFAELRGKRLVIAGELEEGMRLDTATVKKLCSTDSIQAEKKYQAPFSFTPSHTLVLFTNHLPKVGTSDAGTWRRLVVVPFDAVIDGSADIKNYADYLFENAGEAVMAWIVEGAAKFIQGGYRTNPPKTVQHAIDDYRQASDWLSHFITDCCEVAKNYTEQAGNLYTRYRDYCVVTGEYTRSAADFRTALIAAGYEARKTTKGAFYYGLRLKQENATNRFNP